MRVKLKAIGDNYYRCDKLNYCTKADKNLDILGPNDMYSILMDRGIFLSPYNIWQVQLNTDTTRDSTRQSKLNEFIGEEMDVHLAGNSVYAANVNVGQSTCYNSELKYNCHLDRTFENGMNNVICETISNENLCNCEWRILCNVRYMQSLHHLYWCRFLFKFTCVKKKKKEKKYGTNF